ncbi:hypothetical protein WH96_13285 [Kiloniella spongiae]|uniref:Uncharacterized protein n=1 Tax=Kiloniella spongiae TaxID=1489064 RepID=A0A0H2MD74_9PROT|nr:hypothetical protein [Kiloniella spongiae]KLN60156.1 hypothetical protein WH96_13285 [Kiloniella spongiae]
MHRPYGVILKCFLFALVIGIITQLTVAAGFIRWATAQGSDYSSKFWQVATDTWHQDGLTAFLICMATSLIVYLVIRKFTAHQKTAEKIITWFLIPITLLYSLIMYPNFADYL